MNRRLSNNSAPKAGVLLLLLAGSSLLLNLCIAIYLLNQRSGDKTPSEPSDNTSFETSASSAAETRAPTESAETGVPAFHWSEIESTDYRQYIANLRALGVPEPVIRDIIVSDLSQHYVKRAREIWQPRVTEYWQKSANERPSPKQLEQLMALGKEHDAMTKELLGMAVGRQELIDLFSLQVQGSERQLLFLPRERRETALQVLAETDLESKELMLRSEGSYSSKDEQKLFNEKLALLADVLSPEELEEFHGRNSPSASILRSQVRFFNLTREEHYQLLLATEAAEGKQHTKDIVRKLFGDERAKEFELVSSAFYINARTGAEAEGIALERAEQAARLANDSMASGLATVNDKTLSVEERKARLLDLQTQTYSKLKALLGDKASQPVIRDLRNFLRSSTVYIKP